MFDTTTLTAAQTEFMTLVGRGSFSFFDNGITEGSDSWGDCLTEEFADMTGCSKHAAAGVLSGLSKTELWDVEEYDGDHTWALTAAGAEVANHLATIS